MKGVCRVCRVEVEGREGGVELEVVIAIAFGQGELIFTAGLGPVVVADFEGNPRLHVVEDFDVINGREPSLLRWR